MQSRSLPTIDFGPYTDEFMSLFKDTITDVTHPVFVQEMTDLASDALMIAALRLQNADPIILSRVDAAVKARAITIANIPGLVVAGKQQAAINTVTHVAGMLASYGVSVLTTMATGGLSTLLTGVLNGAFNNLPKSTTT